MAFYTGMGRGTGFSETCTRLRTPIATTAGLEEYSVFPVDGGYAAWFTISRGVPLTASPV